MKEKRKYIRIRKNFRAVVHLLGGTEQKTFEVKGINISEEGMMVRSPVQLLQKTKLKIKILYSSIEIIGIVVYAKEDIWNKKTKNYIFGIHFTSISLTHKRKIAQYVKKTMKKYTWKHWL